ncbi:MAG: 3-deoxy-manno-octulosonate cytidylyltransferase [Acidobacteria bacterium]|jgi:3-deoxy-manno-octulosonate cytidylyltransferase (CMP-KDO synthetase)|nr:3-deoxy-manno-octulosonate cytidylyltransferase [Acidobacteriota bacterium]
MTKVAGLIPARFSSNRLPGKVLVPILGKPMIQRVYERVLQAEVLDVILVGTDDERVAEVVRGFGGRVVLTSPEHPSGTDRLAEMVQRPDSGVADADIVVNIQADQPFMDPRMIEEAVRPLLDDPDLPMATLRRPISRPGDLEDPAVVKVVVDHQGDALYFSRSRIPNPCTDVPHPVFKHVGLYVYRRDFLIRLSELRPTLLERVESLEQLRVLEHGHKIRVVETQTDDHEFGGFSVDTREDLTRAESMLRERGLD